MSPNKTLLTCNPVSTSLVCTCSSLWIKLRPNWMSSMPLCTMDGMSCSKTMQHGINGKLKSSLILRKSSIFSAKLEVRISLLVLDNNSHNPITHQSLLWVKFLVILPRMVYKSAGDGSWVKKVMMVISLSEIWLQLSNWTLMPDMTWEMAPWSISE